MKKSSSQARGADASRHGGSSRRRTSGHISGNALMALLLAASVVVAVSAATRPSQATPVDTWVTVSVPTDGTLWDLAESHAVPGLDTPAVVQLIEARNALASATVYEGQTILVPGEPDAPPVTGNSVAVAAR